MIKYIHGTLSTIGLMGIYGTFGAVDNGNISDTRCFIQALCFMAVFVGFGILAKKSTFGIGVPKRANIKINHL